MDKKGALERINDIVFHELERLDGTSTADPEAMRAEIERAKTVKGLADTVIDNGNLALRAAQASTGVGEAVRTPRMLLSEGGAA